MGEAVYSTYLVKLEVSLSNLKCGFAPAPQSSETCLEPIWQSLRIAIVLELNQCSWEKNQVYFSLHKTLLVIIANVAVECMNHMALQTLALNRFLYKAMSSSCLGVTVTPFLQVVKPVIYLSPLNYLSWGSCIWNLFLEPTSNPIKTIRFKKVKLSLRV